MIARQLPGLLFLSPRKKIKFWFSVYYNNILYFYIRLFGLGCYVYKSHLLIFKYVEIFIIYLTGFC